MATRLGVHDLPVEDVVICGWVERKLGNSGHERRVARLAGLLFDATRTWHGLGKAERRLLRHGALVHDVGRAGGAEGHAERGARMIVDTAIPLGDAERRRLAFLARHHRGAVPAEGHESYLQKPADNLAVMRVLLGLLRVADGLDSRAMRPPQIVVSTRGKVLSIHGYTVGDAGDTHAALGRPRKMRLLEETLGCTIELTWFGSDALAMAS